MRAWTQVYEPHGFPWWLSALVAALPIAVLFWLLAVRRAPAHISACGGAATAILVAVAFPGMPPSKALAAFAYGAAFGAFPVGWVVLSAIFVYQIAVDTGQFEIMKASVARLTPDRRIQAIIIAFAFGAMLEGAAGFGAPVAISAALLVGLGFDPFRAAVLCLIANTAPVAWGSLGTPLIALEKVSGIPIADLSAMNARILPFTSLILPLWIVRAMVPWRETLEVLPAAVVSGASFALAQLVWGNFIDPGLVDLVAGSFSLLCLAGLLVVWRPKRAWRFPSEVPAAADVRAPSHPPGQVLRAWLPFILLFTLVIGWGLLRTKTPIDRLEWGALRATYAIPVPALHGEVLRTHPVSRGEAPEEAVYRLSWLSASGTAVLLAGIISAVLLRHGPRALLGSFLVACRRMRLPILAIAPMMGLGFVTRYGGLDAILGLAFTRTGVLYPFFGTLLGWLGVALTGSDTSSNVLFGSLQRITAEQLGISPVLMCSANSAGGVMGKMIDAQSIVVASAASNRVGDEGRILVAVFWHSIALASIVALIVVAYAYLFPGAIPHDVRLLG